MVRKLILYGLLLNLISCAQHQDLLAPEETGMMHNVNLPFDSILNNKNKGTQ